MEEANSKSYGINLIRYHAVIIWNKLQDNIASNLTELNRIKVPKVLMKVLKVPKILLNMDEPIKNMKKTWSYMNSFKIIQTFFPPLSLSHPLFSSFLLSTISLFFYSLLCLYISSFPIQDSNLIVLKSRIYARLENVTLILIY